MKVFKIIPFFALSLLLLGSCSSSKTSSSGCGEDLACFIKAVESGKKSKATIVKSYDNSPMKTSSTTFIEVKGYQQDDAVFYLRFDDMDVEFSPDKKMKGPQLERMKKTEAKLKENYKTMIGLEQTCTLSKTDLLEMLKRWETGKISSDDLTRTGCSGSFVDFYTKNQ